MVITGNAFTVKLTVATAVHTPFVPVIVNGYTPAAVGVEANVASVTGAEIPDPVYVGISQEYVYAGEATELTVVVNGCPIQIAGVKPEEMINGSGDTTVATKGVVAE